MKNELYQHKKSDMVKWIITFIVGLLLIAAVVALFIKLDRQTTTTTIPKGTDFTKYSDKSIQFIEDWVNAYPREIFGFACSKEMFEKQLAAL